MYTEKINAAFHSDTERAAGRQAAELRGTPSTHHCLGVRVTSDFCQRASEVSCPGAPDAEIWGSECMWGTERPMLHPQSSVTSYFQTPAYCTGSEVVKINQDQRAKVLKSHEIKLLISFPGAYCVFIACSQVYELLRCYTVWLLFLLVLSWGHTSVGTTILQFLHWHIQLSSPTLLKGGAKRILNELRWTFCFLVQCRRTKSSFPHHPIPGIRPEGYTTFFLSTTIQPLCFHRQLHTDCAMPSCVLFKF